MSYQGKRYLRKIESGLFVIVLLGVLVGVLGRAMALFAAAPENAGKKNPHKDDIQSFQQSCLACHSSDPLKQNQGADTVHFEKCKAQCSTCHTIPQSCILISTEKATQILTSQLHYLGLPLLSGSIACGSCHYFHDRGSRGASEHKLNTLYANFWYRAQQIDPHRANVFCQLCHDGEPITSQGASQVPSQASPQTPSQGTSQMPSQVPSQGASQSPSQMTSQATAGKVTLKADRVAVCLQCHDGKKARADNHPVRVVPTKEKGVNVPENFPLSDGKVSCITCHMMPCQGGKIERNLLRGGPYEKRVDICLTCHMKERYQAVNPHIQVDEKGHILKTKCLYCHII